MFICIFIGLAIHNFLLILFLLTVLFSHVTLAYPQGYGSRAERNSVLPSHVSPLNPLLHFASLFVDFEMELWQFSLCPVGQIIILKRFQSIFKKRQHFISPISIQKSTSTLITPYKNFNDHTSAELQESY